jgi:phosphonate transport system ATP-binding protein
LTLGFEGVEKHFGSGPAALAGVSFAVPRGEFCVVLGASGAGKSTLLRCVNGLVKPTMGRVVIDGETVEPANLRHLRQRIGMIHQSFSLVARSSVARNVIAGALPAVSTLRALSGLFPLKYRLKACELIEEVGLKQDHLKRRVSTLSGGEQQRVGIARAFMLDPAIVLADEPVASLDPQTSVDILELIARQCRSRSTTVLCSLHQTDLALRFAGRVVALCSGRIVFDGPPHLLSPDAVKEIYGRSRGGLPSPVPEKVACSNE